MVESEDPLPEIEALEKFKEMIDTAIEDLVDELSNRGVV